MPIEYFHLNAQTTVVVSGGLTDLVSVVVNKAAAASVVDVFDGNTTTTSALPKVASIDASATGNFFYGCVCGTGIIVTMSGGTADITVNYDQYPSTEQLQTADFET